MANEITIPALPCASINDTLTFYVALGFEITYQQARPNTYACVKYEDIEIHFFTMKGVEPANSYSTCLVLVTDADTLYQSFAGGLRQQYGRLPVAGIPRITRPHRHHVDGDWRFNVIDPGGNWIRFIQKTHKAEDAMTSDEPSTKLSRATHAAHLLVNATSDFPAAAKVLDKALKHRDEDVPITQRIRALVLRAEVAANMADHPLAKNLLADMRQLALTVDEQVALAEELQRAEELSLMLTK